MSENQAFQFDEGSDRRMPVYLLLDTSGSMIGDPLKAVEQGVQLLHNELIDDPASEELVWISVITFDDAAKQLMPLTQISNFSPPSLSANGGTSMGAAFRELNRALGTEIKTRTVDQKGDYRPLIFLLTDGNPTDDYMAGLNELKTDHSKQLGNIICLGCGSQVSKDTLKKISASSLMLNDVDSESIKAFFKWVSMSIKTTSKNIGLPGSGQETKVDLPEPPPGFQVIL